MWIPIKHILILYLSLKKWNLNFGTLGSYSTQKYSFLLKRWQKYCESQSCILEYDESVVLKCHDVIHNICAIAMVYWHLIVVLWALTSSCVLRSTYTYTWIMCDIPHETSHLGSWCPFHGLHVETGQKIWSDPQREMTHRMLVCLSC